MSKPTMSKQAGRTPTSPRTITNPDTLRFDKTSRGKRISLNPVHRGTRSGLPYRLRTPAALEVLSLLLDEPGLASEDLLFDAYDSLAYPENHASYLPLDSSTATVSVPLDPEERLELRSVLQDPGHVLADSLRTRLARKFSAALA